MVWLVEPTNGIEVQLENLQKITTSGGRNITKTAGVFTNSPLIVQNTPLPYEWQFETSQLTSFEDTKRKLTYMSYAGLDVLCAHPSNEEAMLGAIEIISMPEDVERLNIQPLSVRFVGKGTILGYMKEAEDATIGAGAAAAADANASGGSCVQLNANAEAVYILITQSIWALPTGDYRVYVRAKDSAQVAGDLTLGIYNSTDATWAGSASKTLTASYAWYSVDVTTAADDVGDLLEIIAQKASATANTISIDIICVVPI